MFEALLAEVVSRTATLHQRPEGVSFLRLAKDLYKLTDVAYLGVDVAVARQKEVYVHCTYSNTSVRYCIGNRLVAAAPDEQKATSAITGDINAEDVLALVIPLTSHFGETAFFGLRINARHVPEVAQNGRQLFGALGNYFHSHVLRIHGHDCDDDIVLSAKELASTSGMHVAKSRKMSLSARELDCLRWTAEGKTAWETSLILGISERTVRFHQNAAREKLGCATTTQAVAKAVVTQLIHIGDGPATGAGQLGARQFAGASFE
jgi:DNA-binding CsgD family transcriptional regulator